MNIYVYNIIYHISVYLSLFIISPPSSTLTDFVLKFLVLEYLQYTEKVEKVIEYYLCIAEIARNPNKVENL